MEGIRTLIEGCNSSLIINAREELEGNFHCRLDTIISGAVVLNIAGMLHSHHLLILTSNILFFSLPPCTHTPLLSLFPSTAHSLNTSSSYYLLSSSSLLLFSSPLPLTLLQVLSSLPSSSSLTSISFLTSTSFPPLFCSLCPPPFLPLELHSLSPHPPLHLILLFTFSLHNLLFSWQLSTILILCTPTHHSLVQFLLLSLPSSLYSQRSLQATR